MRKAVAIFVLLLLMGFAAGAKKGGTKVVLLGTGTPNPDPERTGSSVAIIAGNTAYIVDFGAGVVRRAAALSPRYGGKIKALLPEKLRIAFLTHLHSDHTLGYADLILTPWIMGRNRPLIVYGPEGLKKMTQRLLEAYQEDIKYRLYGLEPANNQGWKVEVHEIEKEGVIYRDGNVEVEAFPVKHGSWPDAYGFRFKTRDKVIVVSGDTAPCAKIVEYARGADILIHEVYSLKGFQKRSKEWKIYHSSHHTSTVELAEIAAKARPKLLVLYHILFWGTSEEEILEEIRSKYDGKVIVGRDLMVIE